jgi:hypothetical protein
VTATDIPPAVAYNREQDGCRLLEVDAGHDLMVSAPEATADALCAMAED